MSVRPAERQSFNKAIDKTLSKVYYDLKSPASFAGINKILEEARKVNPKINMEHVTKFLEKQTTYTLHKPIQKPKPRLKTVPSGFHTDWQSKRSEDMIKAFETIFKNAKVLPNKLYSDAGLEFQANKMKKYFDDKTIIKHVMHSPHLHAGVVERANRTIKERLYKYFTQNNTYRWIDVIDKIIKY